MITLEQLKIAYGEMMEPFEAAKNNVLTQLRNCGDINEYYSNRLIKMINQYKNEQSITDVEHIWYILNNK